MRPRCAAVVHVGPRPPRPGQTVAAVRLRAAADLL